MKKVHGWRAKLKISELKIKEKKELLETKLTSRCKKTQRSSSKIVTSKAFQRVTDETLQESHLKFFGNEAQNFQIQKNEKHRIIVEDRINF